MPFFLIERPKAARIARVSSLLLHWSELCLVTEADARGRECADRQRLIDAVDLTRLFCEEHGVLTAAYPFPSPSARVAYAAGDQADPNSAEFETSHPVVQKRIEQIQQLMNQSPPASLAASGRPILASTPPLTNSRSLDGVSLRVNSRFGSGAEDRPGSGWIH